MIRTAQIEEYTIDMWKQFQPSIYSLGTVTRLLVCVYVDYLRQL